MLFKNNITQTITITLVLNLIYTQAALPYENAALRPLARGEIKEQTPSPQTEEAPDFCRAFTDYAIAECGMIPSSLIAFLDIASRSGVDRETCLKILDKIPHDSVFDLHADDRGRFAGACLRLGRRNIVLGMLEELDEIAAEMEPGSDAHSYALVEMAPLLVALSLGTNKKGGRRSLALFLSLTKTCFEEYGDSPAAAVITASLSSLIEGLVEAGRIKKAANIMDSFEKFATVQDLSDAYLWLAEGCLKKDKKGKARYYLSKTGYRNDGLQLRRKGNALIVKTDYYPEAQIIEELAETNIPSFYRSIVLTKLAQKAAIAGNMQAFYKYTAQAQASIKQGGMTEINTAALVFESYTRNTIKAFLAAGRPQEAEKAFRGFVDYINGIWYMVDLTTHAQVFFKTAKFLAEELPEVSGSMQKIAEDIARTESHILIIRGVKFYTYDVKLPIGVPANLTIPRDIIKEFSCELHMHIRYLPQPNTYGNQPMVQITFTFKGSPNSPAEEGYFFTSPPMMSIEECIDHCRDMHRAVAPLIHSIFSNDRDLLINFIKRSLGVEAEPVPVPVDTARQAPLNQI